MGSKRLIMAFQTRRNKRLQREIGVLLNSTKDEDDCGICVEIPEDGSMERMTAYLQGPPETPYESGLFQLDVHVPQDYPLMPPKINFRTRIWHPNISSVTGAICLDTLGAAWTPSLSVYTCLLAIRALMGSAEPNDPQDAMVANQYMNHFRKFVITAKYWTNEFAAKNPNYCKPKASSSSTSEIMLSRQLSNEVLNQPQSALEETNRFMVPVPSAKDQHEETEPPKEKSDDQCLLEFKDLHEKVISYNIPRTKALEVLTIQNWDLKTALEELNISAEPPQPKKRSKKRAKPSSSSETIQPAPTSSRRTPKPKKRQRTR